MRPVKVLARSISVLRSLRRRVSVIVLESVCKRDGEADLIPEALVSWSVLYEVDRLLHRHRVSAVR